MKIIGLFILVGLVILLVYHFTSGNDDIVEGTYSLTSGKGNQTVPTGKGYIRENRSISGIYSIFIGEKPRSNKTQISKKEE